MLLAYHILPTFYNGGDKNWKYCFITGNVIRIMTLSKFGAHVSPIFKRFQILKIVDLFRLQQLNFLIINT